MTNRYLFPKEQELRSAVKALEKLSSIESFFQCRVPAYKQAIKGLNLHYAALKEFLSAKTHEPEKELNIFDSEEDAY